MTTGSRRPIRLERRGAVAELTLDRPASANAFDAAMHAELPRLLREVAEDREVLAVVLAAAGKFFSAGGDFQIMLDSNASIDYRTRTTDEGRQLIDALLGLPQPIVAALQGDAIGLGATVVLCCDAIVAARGAKISDPHVRIGLVAGDGGCFAWPAALGMPRAKRFLLTGDAVGAEEAYQWGLVTDLVEQPGDALEAARELADRMAALPPLAVQGTKRSLNRALASRADEVLDLSLAHEFVSLGSEDLLEAIAAFKEKRPGRYRGR